MTLRDYVYLFALSALWGTSYPLIKIALAGHLAPAEIVLVRLIIAAAVLYAVARAQGFAMPRVAPAWRSFMVMGLIGTAAPFFLISWGETRIDASLAAVLNATVPLFTVAIAHVWSADERLSARRLLGILIGFAGVVVLTGNVVLDGRSAALLGVAALVLSSVCYGVANNFARHAFVDVPPVVAATGQMTLGACALALPGIVDTVHAGQAPTAAGLAAVAAMALLGTVAAYLLYYRLIARVGSSRTSTVAYMLPAFAVFYGTALLHEALTSRLLFGFALILVGVAVVNGRLGRARRTAPRAAGRAAR